MDAKMIAAEARAAEKRVATAETAQARSDYRREQIQRARQAALMTSTSASAALAYLAFQASEALEDFAMPVEHDFRENLSDIAAIALEAALNRDASFIEEESEDEGAGIGIQKGTLAAAVAALKDKKPGEDEEPVETNTAVAQATIDAGTVERAREAALAEAQKKAAKAKDTQARKDVTSTIESGTVAAAAGRLAQRDAAQDAKEESRKKRFAQARWGRMKGKVKKAASANRVAVAISIFGKGLVGRHRHGGVKTSGHV